MLQLKVIIVGTFPTETIRLEEALQQTGFLSTFRYVDLGQAMEHVPDWGNWDLIIARYQEAKGVLLLSFLAPILRQAAPPVFFLTDAFTPELVIRLLNAGGRRVVPIGEIENVLYPSLEGVFDLGALAPAKRLVDEIQPASEQYVISEDGIAHLFEKSSIGISIIRLADRKCIDCNESFARLLEWPRNELLRSNLLELGLPNELYESLQNGNKQLIKDGFERKIYTKNRQVRNIRIHLDQINWHGQECIFALIEDVTEQDHNREKVKRLNDDLERMVLVKTGALNAANRELEAEIGRRKSLEDFTNQLSQTLRETPDVVAIGGPDGKLQYLNAAGRRMFDFSEDGPVSHLDLLFPYSEEGKRWIISDVQPRLLKDGTWRGDTEFHLPDGKIIPVSQVMVCKKNDGGHVMYYATIARDISDFRRVEQELRQSRERYRTLAEAAHDFIFMVSKEGVMEYANEFACQALGHLPEKVEGMLARQFFPNDFAVNHLQMFYEVHEIDRPVYTEGPFNQGAEDYWLGTWLVPIHNQRGSLVSVLGISRDITEQKKTDEALQRALANERQLAEIRSNFFSMTSHQFRTPLSTILLSAELLQKYGPRWDEAKRFEQLSRILEAANRLNRMLEDILVIGRVESGKYICTPKDFDLIDFTQKVVDEISSNDRGRHLIVFRHDVDELPVFLDQEVLRRVIDNLMSNAVKYSLAGTLVKVEIRIENNFFLLEVADQGIGIPENDVKYLFQPFQRGSNALDYPGSGIGLTIIQKSVELLNGTVSVKTKENQGTTFVVRFPARLVSPVDPVAN